MFYVLVFGLLAVVLIVAGLTAMSRRRRGFAADEIRVTHGPGGPAPRRATSHGNHAGAAERRNRKAKRAQSQHDRRKRH
jgi:hypothetical protein